MKYITVKQLYEKLNAQHPGIKSRKVTNLINMVLKEYIDNFGLKHRECIYLCRFDDHRIKKYQVCKNYKKVNRS